jgi:hypothetical protein
MLCSLSGAPGSLVGTMFVISDFVPQERLVTAQNALAYTFPAPSTATRVSSAPVPAPPSWPWRRATLLLAVAPAQLAAAAAFVPALVNRLAAVIAVLVLVAGIAGPIMHTGLFFVSALMVLAVGAVKLWREQSWALAGG